MKIILMPVNILIMDAYAGVIATVNSEVRSVNNTFIKKS